jgi:hypothetical protein
MFIEILFRLINSFSNSVQYLEMACPFKEFSYAKINNNNKKEFRKNYNLDTHGKDMNYLQEQLIRIFSSTERNTKLVEIISKMVYPIPSKRYIKINDILNDFIEVV